MSLRHSLSFIVKKVARPAAQQSLTASILKTYFLKAE